MTALAMKYPLPPPLVSSILRSGLLDRFGSPVGVACGYLSSDTELAGGVRMGNFYLAVSDGIRPLNSSKLFRKWMESHFGREVMEVGVAHVVRPMLCKQNRLECPSDDTAGGKLEIIPPSIHRQNQLECPSDVMV